MGGAPVWRCTSVVVGTCVGGHLCGRVAGTCVDGHLCGSGHLCGGAPVWEGHLCGGAPVW